MEKKIGFFSKNPELIARLSHLYGAEGIDVSIRKVANVCGTTHTKLLRNFGSKQNLMFKVYEELTTQYILFAVKMKSSKIQLAQNQIITQEIRMQREMGICYISMQLWGRPTLRDQLINTLMNSLFNVCLILGWIPPSTPRKPESLHGFVDMMMKGKGDIDIMDFNSAVIIHSSFTLFMSAGGIDLLKMIGGYKIPGTTESLEIIVSNNFAQLLTNAPERNL